MKRLFQHVRNQWAGFLALFLVLAGGTAYAAGTITSTDIIDGEVNTADLANQAVTGAKLGSAAVSKGKIAGNSVDATKIADESITAADIARGTIGGTRFLWSGYADLNFGDVASQTCAASQNLTIPGYDSGLSSHVLVTPPPGYPTTFTLEPRPVSGVANQLTLVACNNFPLGGSVDPDGAGGRYPVLVISRF
jgi:hypothetical protein